MANLDQISSEIHQIISSLKLSIEPTLARHRKDIPVAAIALVVGELEQIRFKFYSSARSIGQSTDREAFDKAIEQLKNDLVNISMVPEFERISSRFTFRLRPPVRDTTRAILMHEPQLLERINVFEAFKIIFRVVSDIENSSDPEKLFTIEEMQLELTEEPQQGENHRAAQNLKRIIPNQKIAPVRFTIVDDKISIETVPSQIGDRDKSNTQIARDQILENGKTIIEHLRKSNCDKRLIENIEHLHSQIEGEANAIQIGISNIAFGVMSGNFRNELPDAISSMLQSHNISVNMYVAQFPDWNRFSENASIADISSEDVVTVESSARQIIELLEANEEIAEPRVVKAFKRLRELTKDPTKANKRAVFAVIRTIENLLSNTFQYAASYLEETAKEIKKGAAKATAGLIISVALTGATSLSPISNKINELSWLKNAIEIVQRQLKVPK